MRKNYQKPDCTEVVLKDYLLETIGFGDQSAGDTDGGFAKPGTIIITGTTGDTQITIRDVWED